MIDGNSEDFYVVSLAAGQRVLFDCEAQRLDSPLDGVMNLTDSADAPWPPAPMRSVKIRHRLRGSRGRRLFHWPQ
ncbi:MAG: hypothetical protein R3B96_20815 [Pirellulaceae bacterium]